jgi:hypothetical protein
LPDTKINIMPAGFYRQKDIIAMQKIKKRVINSTTHGLKTGKNERDQFIAAGRMA